MGYTTTFQGKFKFSQQLTLNQFNELKDLYERNFSLSMDTMLRKHKLSQHDQLQWVPDKHGHFLEWDGGEKFYNYVEWLEFLIANCFYHWNVILDGKVFFQGESSDDSGFIEIVNNNITVKTVANMMVELNTVSENDIQEMMEIIKDVAEESEYNCASASRAKEFLLRKKQEKLQS